MVSLSLHLQNDSQVNAHVDWKKSFKLLIRLFASRKWTRDEWKNMRDFTENKRKLHTISFAAEDQKKKVSSEHEHKLPYIT